MQLCNLIVDGDGYLVNPETKEKVTFWECDPSKNIFCTKTMCRGCVARNEAEIGFCSSTPEAAFAKIGARPFYKRLNSEGYFGREYLFPEGGGDHDDQS